MDEILKYNFVLSSFRSNRINFFINLEVVNRILMFCSKKSGENRIGIGIYLVVLGVF